MARRLLTHSTRDAVAGVSVSKETSDIEYDILSYMADNPDAQDTLEGIVQWWLLERKLKHETPRVKEVVAELVSRGLILERINASSRTHYKINRSRMDEIHAVLRQLKHS